MNNEFNDVIRKQVNKVIVLMGGYILGMFDVSLSLNPGFLQQKYGVYIPNNALITLIP